MSLKSIRVVAVFAAAALAIPQAASAQITEDTLRSLRLHGLHLGMTPAELEAIIRSRSDLSEVRGNVDGIPFDCNLAPDQSAPKGLPTLTKGKTPNEYAFEDADHRGYYISFSGPIPKPLAIRIRVSERRTNGGWQTDLSEAEARFGKPSFVLQDLAGWCVAGDKGCDNGSNDGPRLLLRFHAHGPGELEPGDSLNFDLEEGIALRRKRIDDYVTTAQRAPARARVLSRECLTRVPRYADDYIFMQHLVSLMPMGWNDPPPVFKVDAVPPAVFAALGLDAKRDFGPGICFNSFDVIIERPECKRYVSIGFRWARRVGNMWVMAFFHGGGSLSRDYFAARRLPDGRYEKVWWSRSLVEFNKWRTQGAVPMRGQSDF